MFCVHFRVLWLVSLKFVKSYYFASDKLTSNLLLVAFIVSVYIFTYYKLINIKQTIN